MAWPRSPRPNQRHEYTATPYGPEQGIARRPQSNGRTRRRCRQIISERGAEVRDSEAPVFECSGRRLTISQNVVLDVGRAAPSRQSQAVRSSNRNTHIKRQARERMICTVYILKLRQLRK